MRLATKRKHIWVQKVPKKGSKSELLKKSKIELSLQRELNPARRKTPQKDLKTGLFRKSIETKLVEPKRALKEAKMEPKGTWSRHGGAVAARRLQP